MTILEIQRFQNSSVFHMLQVQVYLGCYTKPGLFQ